MLERRATYVLIGATFLLLLIGGTVNPTGSSLACPEPTLVCHGELFPEMTGGVLYEHGHRLAAMAVGFLQIGLTLLLWRRRPRLRRLGVLALALVCVQGAFGAITVQFKLPWAVSTTHLLLALGYFAILLLIARRLAPAGEESERPPLPSAVRTVVGAMTLALLFQILLGGLVRHHGAALASVDLPLHDGALWPAGGPALLKLHMAHRIVGALVGALVIGGALYVASAARGVRRLRVLALALPPVVLTQVGLGALVIASFRAVPVAVAHFGGAALLWTILCSMWWTLSEARTEAEPSKPQEVALDIRKEAVAR